MTSFDLACWFEAASGSTKYVMSERLSLRGSPIIKIGKIVTRLANPKTNQKAAFLTKGFLCCYRKTALIINYKMIAGVTYPMTAISS